MPAAEANGINIEYDEFGERSGRPLLLIMGHDLHQMVWPRIVDAISSLTARAEKE
jgi:hypothetical protein